MRRPLRAALLALLFGGAGAPAAGQPAEAWAAFAGPAPGPARVIGSHALGCLAGAEQLPPDGPGWQAIRVSRNRHWGHPDAIRFVRDLAAAARQAGLPDLYIGDIAQPRGGPMPWGHASHQTGLDVDIWLDLTPKPPLPPAGREDLRMPSLVAANGREVDRSRFGAGHVTLLRLAATRPGVDRILVHHAIKRELCRLHAGEAWLRRIRPWRGHDSHMHVRLSCPPGQPECRDIPPPPPGDGCDASLDWWLTPEAERPPRPPPGPPQRLPAACAGVFGAP
ncbi:MAG: penicillin-insensitive murein endopeptidase [Acetobacteraceae bacterium]|nr:penicillin-insensitive murein endopeptidase [Acetobacteraceae bacterium]MDW8398087.1 penicillin-insensitive murein endopeptidase [Acetobacteraceae bacterium]